MRKVTFFIDKEILKEIKEIAAIENRPVVRVMREALELYTRHWNIQYSRHNDGENCQD
jgi:hypothetical protein